MLLRSFVCPGVCGDRCVSMRTRTRQCVSLGLYVFDSSGDGRDVLCLSRACREGGPEIRPKVMAGSTGVGPPGGGSLVQRIVRGVGGLWVGHDFLYLW